MDVQCVALSLLHYQISGWSNNLIPHKPIFYKRCVDDVINRRKKHEEDLLFKKLNYHPKVKLKLVSAIIYQFFIFYRMIALQKLWNMFFISSKKLFSFSRYSNFCIFIFPTFFPVSHCFRG